MSGIRCRTGRGVLLVMMVALLTAGLCIGGVFFAAMLASPAKDPAQDVVASVPEVSIQPESEAEPEESSGQESTAAEEEPEKPVGIFAGYEEQAGDMLRQMSLTEKIGQLFLAALPDADPEGIVQQYQPAGYLLFAKNLQYHNRKTLAELIESCQQNATIPMVFAVDEEGGSVVRVSKFTNFRSEPFAAPQLIYQESGLDGLAADAKEKSQFLLDLGITLNLAPVCDVSVNSSDYIYDRTLGVPAEETARGIGAIVTAMEETGISCALKHFPGYGSNPDTHTGAALDERERTVFEESDFLPFEAGIEAGADLVLVSHNTVTAFDGELPASLSPEIHRLLREELGFTGVIITDDISMDALDSFREDAAVLALEAGNNLIITGDLEQSVRQIQAAVEDGRIPEEALDEAVQPVLAWKLAKNIFS